MSHSTQFGSGALDGEKFTFVFECRGMSIGPEAAYRGYPFSALESRSGFSSRVFRALGPAPVAPGGPLGRFLDTSSPRADNLTKRVS